jgi:hypothetical protein
MHFRQKVSLFVERYPTFVAILTITLIGLLTYLPGINGLGYYRDDWHVTWGGTLLGALKIFDLHVTDRPFMGLIYAITFRLLGNNVHIWHYYVLVLRILGGISVFFILNNVWKNHKRVNLIMATLFVVYPGFLQMPTSSAYSNHLLGLLCGLLAVFFTLKAFDSAKQTHRVILLLLSMPLALVCFGFMEWMMGIEIYLMLFLAIKISKEQPFRWHWHWFKKLILWSVPSAFVFMGFYVWRIFFFTSARSVTDVKSLGLSYIHNTGEMLIRLLIEPILGFLNSVVFSWGIPFYQLSNTVPLEFIIVALLLALIGIGLFWLFYSSNRNETLELQHSSAKQDLKTMVVLGVVFVFVSILPVIIANREVRLTDTFDRYTLLASLGVVMIIVPGLKLLFGNKPYEISVMTLLTIAMMTQMFNTQFFADFWKAERALWWQLSWRAPDLEMDTVILPSMPNDYQLAESYEVWGPANLIYHPNDPLDISGEIINNQTYHWLRSGDQYGKTIRRVDVSMDFSKNLLTSLPNENSCLHVYGEEYPVVSEYDPLLISSLVNYSSYNRIIASAVSPDVPVEIFGEEPEHGWCYTYQKASLAFQQENWEEIIKLGDAAFAQGIEPGDDMELLPFYEAYARSGLYDDANKLGEIIRVNKSISEQFCKVYEPKMDQLQDNEVYMVINICPQFANE